MPKVSIITSVFNSSKFLSHFLKDVVRQTIFHESELLLVDCNGDDRDLEAMKPFLEWLNVKRHIMSPCSVYEAWNEGIRIAESPIITNWNTDDRRRYNSLEEQVVFLEENPETDLCYGATIITTVANEAFEDTRSESLWPALEGTLENQLKHNSPHCLPVWRKNVHERFGFFDTDYKFAADYDMWFRILKNNGKFACLSEPVGLYFQNPDGISTRNPTLKRAFQEVQDIRKKYAENQNIP